MSLLRNLVLSWGLSLVSLVSGVATAAASELPNLDPLRFATEIMAFQEWEAKTPYLRAAFCSSVARAFACGQPRSHFPTR